MNKTEQIAYQYLINDLSIPKEEITFNGKGPIDFETKSHRKFEAKTLLFQKGLGFSKRQAKVFPMQNPEILVIKENKVVDHFFYLTLEQKGYKPYVMSVPKPNGMKTVRIEDNDHAQLVAYTAYLTLEKKRNINLAEAIHELLETASTEHYKKGLEGLPSQFSQEKKKET